MPSRWDHSPALAKVPPSPLSSQPLLSLPAGPQHQRGEERRPEMRDWPLLMHLSSLPLGFQGSLQRTAPQCVSELPSPWVLLLSRAPRPTPSQQRCCICLILSIWLGFCLGDREVLLEKKKARASSFKPGHLRGYEHGFRVRSCYFSAVLWQQRMKTFGYAEEKRLEVPKLKIKD